MVTLTKFLVIVTFTVVFVLGSASLIYSLVWKCFQCGYITSSNEEGKEELLLLMTFGNCRSTFGLPSIEMLKLIESQNFRRLQNAIHFIFKIRNHVHCKSSFSSSEFG